MKRLIKKLLKFQREDEQLRPEKILANYISFARELESVHVEDIYKLVNILGRKIQYEHFHHLISLGGARSRSGHKMLTVRDLLVSSKNFLLNEKSWYEFNDLFKPHQLEDEKEIDFAQNIVFPWPWKLERLEKAFKDIGKDRIAGEWKYDKTNHDVEWWEPVGIGIVHRGNHSMTAGVVSNIGKMNIKFGVNLKDAYARITCDGNFYYMDQKKVAKVENLDFAIIFELGRILNDHKIKLSQLSSPN